MNKNVAGILKILLFFGVGAFLIWLSVRNLSDKDKSDITNALQRANYFWIIVSVAVGMLSHWSRAIRWKMLLEPLGYKPKTSNTFFAIMIGYLANYAVPRLGEVSRCGVLTRYENISFTESFGTVIVERIVDVLCFFLLMIIVFLVQFDTMYSYLNEHLFSKLHDKFSGSSTQLLIAAVAGISIVVLIFLLRKRIGSLLGEKFGKFLKGFSDGFATIRNLKSFGWFAFHSVFIWFIYYVMLHLCFFSMDETKDLTVGAGLTTLLFGTVMVMVTPGGIGAYPLAVQGVLLLYMVNSSIGYTMGWLAWLSQFVAILFFGLLSLILLPILNSKHNETAPTNPSGSN